MHTFTLDKPDNLIDWWEESVNKFADRKLFGNKNKNGVYEWITYQEIGDRINHLRAGLAQLDVNQGDVVGIIANNRPEWPFALLPRGDVWRDLFRCMKQNSFKYGNTSSRIVRSKCCSFRNRKFTKK